MPREASIATLQRNVRNMERIIGKYEGYCVDYRNQLAAIRAERDAARAEVAEWKARFDKLLERTPATEDSKV